MNGKCTVAWRWFLAAAIPLLGTGCAVVGSHRGGAPGSDAQANVGIPYMLPKALLPVEVIAGSGGVRIDVLEPVFVGDPAQSYVLRYRGNAFTKDVVKVEVDPKTSLLKSLSVETKDETGEVLKKIIASTVRAESAQASETVLLQTMIDPDDASALTAANGAIAKAVAAHVARWRKACTATPAAAGLNCKALPEEADLKEAALSVTLLPPAQPDKPGGSDTDCALGICHRASLPYRVSLSVLGMSRSIVMLLPNKAPAVSLPLDGKPFVTVKHTVALRNGVVEKYDVDKPSSALAIVSWPLEVYDAVVTTTAKIIQLKIDTSNKMIAGQEQTALEAEKQKAVEARLKKLADPQPESASLVELGKRGRVMSIGAGVPDSAVAKVVVTPKTDSVPADKAPDVKPVPAGKTLPGSDGTADKKSGGS